MSKSIQFLDIFEQPIKRTYEARQKEFRCIVKQLQDLDLLKCPQYLGKLAFLTSAGYVSGRVASYFLAGRVTPVQKNVLSFFLDFLKTYDEENMCTHALNYLSTWHSVIKDAELEENIFLFPLAELASNDPLCEDFSSDRQRYELL